VTVPRIGVVRNARVAAVAARRARPDADPGLKPNVSGAARA
jgi:hypothetical protein